MVISLAGEWESYRRDELRKRLEPAYEETEVVIDLTTAKYVTSTLICALVVTRRQRQERGLPAATLAVKSAFLRRLFNAAGLETHFAIYDSVEAATNR